MPKPPRTSEWNPSARQQRRRRRATAAVTGGLLVLAGAAGGAVVARRMAREAGGWRPLARGLYHKIKDSRRDAAVAAVLAADTERADSALPISNDGLAPGWSDWSWGKHELESMVRVYSGQHAIAFYPKGYEGVYLHKEQTMRTDGYGALTFAITRDAVLSGEVEVSVADASGKFGPHVKVDRTRVQYDAPRKPGQPILPRERDWVRIKIPLADLLGRSPVGGELSGIVFQSTLGDRKPLSPVPIGIDSIALQPDTSLPAAPTEVTVAVNVDPRADRHAISPYIYGMAFAPPDYVSDLRLTVNRWGGNDKTRYNWVQGNATSAARDWNFANKPAGDGAIPPGPSSAADAFVRESAKAGAKSLLTVPTIGWVAKNADNNCRSEGVPGSGGAPLTTAGGAIAGYDPAANREKTSVRSVAREKDARPGDVAQDAWIRHLAAAFGPSGKGGVRFFAMDNEPDLWDTTHTDVHPARMGYDDLANNFWTYARAVKDADPTALVTGPVSWGWTGYTYSPLDRGDDNFHTHADRTKHGGQPFLPWFLKTIHQRDVKAGGGQRTLDVLDVHYYPQAQGVFGDAADPATRAARLRSVRSLWDPAYTDESWIGEPVRLIPRLKEWIAAGYPGTKIGITEWNFGADKDISGGLATAEALGIFGRDGVYLANFWAWPTKNGPGYLAFKLLRNPDGAGHGLGDVSCRAVSARTDRVAVFAAEDRQTGALTLLLINKMRRTTATVPVTVAGGAPAAARPVAWRFSAASPAGALQRAALSAPKPGGGPISLKLPPYSATLVRLDRSGTAVTIAKGIDRS